MERLPDDMDESDKKEWSYELVVIDVDDAMDGDDKADWLDDAGDNVGDCCC